LGILNHSFSQLGFPKQDALEIELTHLRDHRIEQSREPPSRFLGLFLITTKQSCEVGYPAPRRLWQARFYDFNVWTERKRIEKLAFAE